jgi:hypothetical protein
MPRASAEEIHISTPFLDRSPFLSSLLLFSPRLTSLSSFLQQCSPPSPLPFIFLCVFLFVGTGSFLFFSLRRLTSLPSAMSATHKASFLHSSSLLSSLASSVHVYLHFLIPWYWFSLLLLFASSNISSFLQQCLPPTCSLWISTTRLLSYICPLPFIFLCIFLFLCTDSLLLFSLGRLTSFPFFLQQCLPPTCSLWISTTRLS